MSLDGTRDEHVDRIGVKLGRSEPIGKIQGDTAAVAVIFGRAGSFLLIRRVERPDDPWSGQVAFPGGRVEPEDASFSETACREAREEVGLDLKAKATVLGIHGKFRTQEPEDSRSSPASLTLRRKRQSSRTARCLPADG